MSAVNYLKSEEKRLSKLIAELTEKRKFVLDELKKLGLDSTLDQGENVLQKVDSELKNEQRVNPRELFKLGDSVRLNRDTTKKSVYSKYPEVMKVVGFTYRTGAVLVKGDCHKDAVGFNPSVLQKIN